MPDIPERTVHMYNIRATQSPRLKAKYAAQWLRETALRKTVHGKPKPDTSLLECSKAIEGLLAELKAVKEAA